MSTNIFKVLGTVCRECGNLTCKKYSSCSNSQLKENTTTSNAVQQNYVNHTSTYDSSVLASDNLNQSVDDIHDYRTGDEHTTLP